MAAHTPGPWFFEMHPSTVGRPQVLSIQTRAKFDDLEDDDDPTLAGIYSLLPEDYANARLIAAAPDLLEALQNLRAAYSEPDDRICCNGSMCGCQGATKRDIAEHYAKEAIARATGGAD